MVHRRLKNTLVGGLVFASLLIPGVSFGVTASSTTFSFSGTANIQFVIPTGVSSTSIDMAGARGGSPASTGGNGGRLQVGSMPVTAGTTWYINVGGLGTNGAGSRGSGGGGTEGGGMSDIRTSTAFADAIFVAGGGGGGAESGQSNGGAGGDTTAAAGQTWTGVVSGGGPGTQVAGGAPGATLGFTCQSGTSGSSGQGGNGGIANGNTAGSGAGSGYFGGGGGCGQNASGGGGGSSYATTTASGITHTQGYQAGNGYITISYLIGDPVVSGPTRHIKGVGISH